MTSFWVRWWHPSIWGVLFVLAVLVACTNGEVHDIHPLGDDARQTQLPTIAGHVDDGPPAAQHGSDLVGSTDIPCNRRVNGDIPCTSRDVTAFAFDDGRDRDGVARSFGPVRSLEETLDKGLQGAGASPAHLAVRGAASESDLRCGWRGIARTPGQRELAIRYWLNLDLDDTIPSSPFLEILFDASLNVVSPLFQETARANLQAIVEGGLSEEYLFLACYGEYAVQEYILGAGPTNVTVAYDRMGEAHSYDLYRVENDAGMFGTEPLMSEGEYAAHLDEQVQEAEASLQEMIGDRESVVMLAPMGAHNAIAVEAWQAVEQWDLQLDDQGVVQAVRYGVPEGDPEQTQTLDTLRTRITTAAATDAFAGQRIGNVSGLEQAYRDMGAYGDITPEDGSTATFSPAQPPEAYSCASGTAVTSPEVNRGWCTTARPSSMGRTDCGGRGR